MTKLTGIPINTLTEEEKIQTTKWLAQIIVHGTMKHGFTHSDLHVGNLIFNKDSIGIIDFGFVLKFNEKDKLIFYNLLKEFAMDNLEDAAYYTMFLTEPEEARDNLSTEDIKDITNFIIHTYKKATTVDMFFSIYDILQINKKLGTYNLGISPTFYKGVVGLNSIEGVLSHLSSTTSDFVICAITDFVET
jgi:predicted unusual protein kinase regulating ubiquinone biosynthesis (AarF/ABC1/UbiB family)